MANKRKLGFEEEKALINWFAGNAKTWDSYVAFCDHFGIGPDRRFTPDYLRNWQHRKIHLIKERERQRVNLLAEGSQFDRRRRLLSHEASLGRIEEALGGTGLSVRDIVLLEEQKRKVLESIARERGEVKPDRSDDDVDDQKAAAALQMASGFQRFFSAKKAEVIDAESTVV